MPLMLSKTPSASWHDMLGKHDLWWQLNAFTLVAIYSSDNSFCSSSWQILLGHMRCNELTTGCYNSGSVGKYLKIF